MVIDISHLTGSSAPAPQPAIDRANVTIPGGLPQQLAALYELTDGVLTDDGVTIYPAGDIAERNVTYEVDTTARGYVLIGDDSGAEGFLLRADDPDSPVYSAELDSIDPEDFEEVADDFDAWVATL